MTVFVDTSAWFAAVFKRYRHNLQAKQLLASEALVTDDILAAESVRARFPDQAFSLVDRTSFVVMERLGITRVISFDNDFVIYRYGASRDRAFEVLR